MKDFNYIKEWLMPKLDAKGISVEALANAVGVTRGAIYFYLDDTCRPETQTMARICQFLGVPLEEGLKQFTPKKRGRPRHAPKIPLRAD